MKPIDIAALVLLAVIATFGVTKWEQFSSQSQQLEQELHELQIKHEAYRSGVVESR